MTMSANHMEIMAARGIDVELLDRLGFSSAPRGDGSALVIPFRRNGHVVHHKYRRWDAKEGGNGKWGQDPGGMKLAFNEDCLRDPALIGHPLIITEGEFDALAAIQSGFAKTISIPDGAPPPGDRSLADIQHGQKYDWIFSSIALFDKDAVPEIIIAADDDPNGAALFQDLQTILGRYRCKFLTYPKCRIDRGRERCKDLNEVLQDYGAKGIVETIARAKFVKVNGLSLMSELPPKPPREVYEIGYDSFGDHYRMRMGDFVVVTGVPSSGKTTFVQDMVCRVVERYGLKVAWGSFEQDPQEDHKRNFRRWFNRMPVFRQTVEEKQAADQWIDRNHVFIVPDDEEDATLDWLLDKMETAVARYGVKIIVIDPWNEMEHAKDRGETTTEYTGRAIKRLKKFAGRFGIHLIVVAHPSKMTRDKGTGTYPEPTLYDISDSAHWYNKADIGLVIHRMNKDDTKAKTIKSRFHDIIGTPGSVIMQFSKDEGRFVEMERGAQT